MAMQTWPLFWNAPSKIFGATFFGSTSSSTMAASLPPSSSVMRFSVSAALAITFFPVAVEPVKEILRMSGWAVRASPRSLASAITLSTPGGSIVLDQRGELQRRQRRGRRRFQHHGVAGQQRRRHLERHQDQREVPGDDRPDTPSGRRCVSTLRSSLSSITFIGRSSEAK